MTVEIKHTYDEIKLIRKWRESLPKNITRKFKYYFIETDNVSEAGYKLYDYYIGTSDNLIKKIASDVSL